MYRFILAILFLITISPISLAMPINDNLASAMVITQLPYIDKQNTLTARTEKKEVTAHCAPQTGASLWYQYTSPIHQQVIFDTFGAHYDTVLSVWQGAHHPLSEIACNDDEQQAAERQSQLLISLEAGSTYFIKVSGYKAEKGQLTFRATQVMSFSNVTATDAVTIPEAPFYQNAQLITNIPNDNVPTASCAPQQGGVWYQYMAPIEQKAVFETQGSNYDTVLAVWRDDQEIACNDNSNDSLQSKLNLVLTAGVTYHISIARFADTASADEEAILVFNTYFLSPHDDQADAVVIDTLPYTMTQTVMAASVENLEVHPSCAPSSQASVWYQYTPTTHQDVSFATLGTRYDTVLSVWQGESHPLLEVSCNDDALTGDEEEYASQISVSLTADTTYWVNVSSLSGETGELVLSAEPVVSDLSITDQPHDQHIEKGQTATLTVTAAGRSSLFYQWYQGYTGDTQMPRVNQKTFTTPALTKTTSFWVRISNLTGHIDSDTVTITVEDAANSIGVDASGKSIATTADFTPRIITTEGQQGNNLTLTPEDTATAIVDITADQTHQGKTVDIVLFIYYNDGQNEYTYQLRHDVGWAPWSGHIVDLVAAETDFILPATHTWTIYEGPLNAVLPGVTRLYIGYRLNNGTLIYSNAPLRFTLQ